MTDYTTPYKQPAQTPWVFRKDQSVFSAGGVKVGTVATWSDRAITVRKSFLVIFSRRFDIPVHVVTSADRYSVHLSVSTEDVANQNWPAATPPATDQDSIPEPESADEPAPSDARPADFEPSHASATTASTAGGAPAGAGSEAPTEPLPVPLETFASEDEPTAFAAHDVADVPSGEPVSNEETGDSATANAGSGTDASEDNPTVPEQESSGPDSATPHELLVVQQDEEANATMGDDIADERAAPDAGMTGGPERDDTAVAPATSAALDDTELVEARETAQDVFGSNDPDVPDVIEEASAIFDLEADERGDQGDVLNNPPAHEVEPLAEHTSGDVSDETAAAAPGDTERDADSSPENAQALAPGDETDDHADATPSEPAGDASEEPPAASETVAGDEPAAEHEATETTPSQDDEPPTSSAPVSDGGGRPERSGDHEPRTHGRRSGNPETEGTDWVSAKDHPEIPDGFPIKGNADSGIYHTPGSSAYTSTIAEIYFSSEEAAQRAGFRAPRRPEHTAENSESPVKQAAKKRRRGKR